MKVMLLITSPDGFDGWSQSQKLARYQRIMDWHDYVRERSPNLVTHVWGSHQITEHREPTGIKDVYVVVVDVPTLDDLDEYLYNDPLRDCSRYMSVLLTELNNDWIDDTKRFEDASKALLDNNGNEAPELQRLREQFKSVPEYVGKYDFNAPANPVVAYDSDSKKLPGFEDKPVDCR